MNIWCVYLFKLEFSPDLSLGVELQDHMVLLFLVFCGTSILFSILLRSCHGSFPLGASHTQPMQGC